MVAVRNLLSSLNSLAQSGLLASGWLRRSESDRAVLPAGADTADLAPAPAEDPYMEGGIEPPLDELLDDPLVHLMMRADRLEPEQVRSLLTPGRQQVGA